MSPRPNSILITGATSGIGRALALVYAEPGVGLAITGRDQRRLDEISAECRARGADVTAATLDVRDRTKIAAWIRSIDDKRPIDLAISSAGITSGLGMGRLRENPDAVRSIFAINLMGVLNTIDPLIECMCARASGQIAIVGSIAALRGLPYSPAYCSAKAAVHAYTESLRGMLMPQGVLVSLIIPGFVETALNKDIVSPKPLQMSAQRAARIIRRGLDRGSPTIPFPRLLYYGVFLLRFFPARWVDFILNLAYVDIPETPERMSE